MSLTTINKRELEEIQKRTSLVRASYEVHSLDEAKDLYIKANEIADTASKAIRDGLQGKALLYARKEICAEEWNSNQLTHKTSAKWISFLHSLNLVKNNKPVRNVHYLLDFAGYKEDGGTIEVASHYREVKKIANGKPIDDVYKDLGGSELKTAKDISEAVENKESMSEKVIRFKTEFPEYAKAKETVAYVGMGPELLKRLPQVSREEWKKFYRDTAACIHPDKGGSADNMAILSTMNELYSFIFINKENQEYNKKREELYKEFMKG